MTNAPANELPTLGTWDHQYILNHREVTYRLRQVRPQVWMFSRLGRDGKWDLLATGRKPESAVEAAGLFLRDVASTGRPLPARSGSDRGGVG